MDVNEFEDEIRARREEAERLQIEIGELQQKVKRLQDEAVAFEKVAKILGLNPVSSTNWVVTPESSAAVGFRSSAHSGFKWGKLLSDYAEDILKRHGGPLHIDQIYVQLLALERMKVRIEELGDKPTWVSVDAAIRKDKRKRFRLVNTRTYDLVERLAGQE